MKLRIAFLTTLAVFLASEFIQHSLAWTLHHRYSTLGLLLLPPMFSMAIAASLGGVVVANIYSKYSAELAQTLGLLRRSAFALLSVPLLAVLLVLVQRLPVHTPWAWISSWLTSVIILYISAVFIEAILELRKAMRLAWSKPWVYLNLDISVNNIDLE